MEISINNKPADIVLENEKNMGDLLTGFEQWLEGTGSRLSGLCIDGMDISAAGISEIFELKLDNIKTLDIRISFIDELSMEALAELKEYCNMYADSSFEERARLQKKWEDSAAKAFLAEEIKDVHDLSCLSFTGQGILPENLSSIAEERYRELANPNEEINNTEKTLLEIINRMEELPLDIQTGKDSRASESVQLFSGMGEKLFRILFIFRKRGLAFDSFMVDGMPVIDFLDDFGAALKELTTAYINQDLVLIGDLAEYELAPRLLKLFTALKDFSLAEAVK